jgi:hypothetical protein
MMARLRLRALRRALTSHTHNTHPVHFHNGPQGQPAVCFDGACRRPKLDVG